MNYNTLEKSLEKSRQPYKQLAAAGSAHNVLKLMCPAEIQKERKLRDGAA